MHTPLNEHIDYTNIRVKHESSGMLDLDAQGIDGYFEPEDRVENIIFDDINKMPDGSYDVIVKNYSRKGLNATFNIEVEFNGQIYTYESEPTTSNDLNILTIIKDGCDFEITKKQSMRLTSSNTQQQKVWNINTNQFHTVKLICNSPNHWNDNNIGNKFYMFMVENCKTNDMMRSYHAENLNDELHPYRKTIEALSNLTMIQPSENQLSGFAFNSTLSEEFILKCNIDNKNKIYKIKTI